MRNIMVIIRKQIKDTVKNKTILIQFILFPMMTLIMEYAVKMDGMPEHFFVKLFAVMYIGMAPLTCAASIISEEKEKNTLRVLMMADVKPWQYLIGIGVYVWLVCMIGAALMSGVIGGENRFFFLLIMGIGFIISIIAGSAIGIYSKNQMVATSLTLPVMMVLSFAPMLSMFNETIRKVSAVFFTQQLRGLFDEMSFDGFGIKNASILLVNAVIFVVFFFMAYRKKGLE